MAHCTIDLPGNITVDVRTGKIFKKRWGFFNKWPMIKISDEVKIGYGATVDNVPGKIKTEYYENKQ